MEADSQDIYRNLSAEDNEKAPIVFESVCENCAETGETQEQLQNSIIIMDSDTEKEDNGEKEGDGEEDNDVDSVDDDEEDSNEEKTEDEDSETSSDSDSADSVWSDAGEKIDEEITTEAAEAKIIKKFEKAIISIADQDTEKGQKILEQILEDPIISCFHIDDPDYETIEEPPRLAKMLQIYIATHKNLAKLCEKSNSEADSDRQNEEIQHLRQVLAYDPNNSEIWLDVALKCVEFGDLNFGGYAFKRSESLKESLESQAILLYVKCNYTQCLEILKKIQEENDGLNDKMNYLKMKIRCTNHYYQQLCDKIFDEDEVYVDIDMAKLNNTEIVDFDERIDELRKKVQEKVGIREEEFEEHTIECPRADHNRENIEPPAGHEENENLVEGVEIVRHAGERQNLGELQEQNRQAVIDANNPEAQQEAEEAQLAAFEQLINRAPDPPVNLIDQLGGEAQAVEDLVDEEEEIQEIEENEEGENGVQFD